VSWVLNWNHIDVLISVYILKGKMHRSSLSPVLPNGRGRIYGGGIKGRSSQEGTGITLAIGVDAVWEAAGLMSIATLLIMSDSNSRDEMLLMAGESGFASTAPVCVSTVKNLPAIGKK